MIGETTSQQAEGGLALAVDQLSVSFDGAAVLRDVSFSLSTGSILAVIGPNGSGKTVLFRSLIGMIPYDGVVRWAPGTRLGYVPQKLDLDRDLPLTALDFLLARASVGKIPREAISVVLDAVGMAPTAGRLVGTLSGGQFQRLLLATALLGDPNTLLLDEPTAGIDEEGQERTYDLVVPLAAERRRTVLLISHDLSVVTQHATHVLCLAPARAWFGTPAILTPELVAAVYGSSVRHLR
jgi:zinc transport system ATP-binding protein